MADPLHVTVITPERRVVDAEADAVIIPAHDGELGVLRDRAALLCELGIGQLRYTQGNQTQRVFLDGGFAQVLDNRVTVLSNRALRADEVTAEMVRDAETAAKQPPSHDAEVQLESQRARRRWRSLQDIRLIR
jgi:F-type H+-transporting ATPase subunit epsilon